MSMFALEEAKTRKPEGVDELFVGQWLRVEVRQRAASISASVISSPSRPLPPCYLASIPSFYRRSSTLRRLAKPIPESGDREIISPVQAMRCADLGDIKADRASRPACGRTPRRDPTVPSRMAAPIAPRPQTPRR
jgi:hypothetical protein